MIRNYIEKIEKYSMVISILMIILSLFLIFKPLESLETLIIFFAVIIIFSGIANFISYFLIDRESRMYSFELLTGTITFISGIFLIIYRTELINLFPIILGIWIIVSNLFKLQLSINLSVLKENGWILLVLMSILMIIFGITLITKPFSSAVAITTISGILLLISEVVSLFESIYVVRKLK